MDTESRTLPAVRSSLPTNYASGSLRKALTERMTPSEAVEAVGRLIERYPNGGASAGDGYIGGLSAVLMHYPRSVALRCHDPMKGVPAETKFLPTPSDLIAWCERETESMRRPVEAEDRTTKLAREAQERAEDEDRWQKARLTRPTLDDLKAKYGPNWGLHPEGPARPSAFRDLRDIATECGLDQAAINAIPDAKDYAWKKLHHPGAREAK